MNRANRVPGNRKLAAYSVPMVVFLAFLALGSGLKPIGGRFWLSAPEYWIYPTQTIACGALLIWFRRAYEFGEFRRSLFTLVSALLVFLLWVSPQAFFGFKPRTEGFNPDLFASQPSVYWTVVLLRFVRLVIIVPLVEEIFWRGFLLRYLIDERFDKVAFGTFSIFSFTLVSVAFALGHSARDWLPAILAGMIYNAVAYRTKSLTCCVVAHGVTNFLLGLWIMRTGQWGFW